MRSRAVIAVQNKEARELTRQERDCEAVATCHSAIDGFVENLPSHLSVSLPLLKVDARIRSLNETGSDLLVELFEQLARPRHITLSFLV